MRVNISSRSLAAFLFLSIVAISQATVFWVPVWKQKTVLRYHPKKGWYPVKHGGTGSTFLKPRKLPPLGHVLKSLQKHYKPSKPPAPPPPSAPLSSPPHHKKYRGWRKKPAKKPIVQLPIIKDPLPLPVLPPLPHRIPCPLCEGPPPSSWRSSLSKPQHSPRPPRKTKKRLSASFFKAFAPSKLKPSKKPPHSPESHPPSNILPDFPPSLFTGGPFPPSDFFPKPGPPSKPSHSPKKKRRPVKVSKAFNPFHRIISRHFTPQNSPFKQKRKPKFPSQPYIKLNKVPFRSLAPLLNNPQQFNKPRRRPKKGFKRFKKKPPPHPHHHSHPPSPPQSDSAGDSFFNFPKPDIPNNPFFDKDFNNGPRKPDFKDHPPSHDDEPKVTSFFSNDFELDKLKPMFSPDDFEDTFDFPKDPPKSLKIPKPQVLYSNFESGSSEEYSPPPPPPPRPPSSLPSSGRYHSPRVPRVKSYPPSAAPIYLKYPRGKLRHPSPPPSSSPPSSKPPSFSRPPSSSRPILINGNGGSGSGSGSEEEFDSHSGPPPSSHFRPSPFTFNGFPPLDYSPKLRDDFTPLNNFYKSKDFPKTDHLHDLGEQHLPIPKEFANFAYRHGFSGISGFASGRPGQGWGHWVW